jgi:hypothetical protein
LPLLEAAIGTTRAAVKEGGRDEGGGALYLSLTSSHGGRARHVARVRVAEKDIDGGVPLWRPDLLVGAPIQSDLVVAGGTMVNAVELGTRGWHPMVTGG